MGIAKIFALVVIYYQMEYVTVSKMVTGFFGDGAGFNKYWCNYQHSTTGTSLKVVLTITSGTMTYWQQ